MTHFAISDACVNGEGFCAFCSCGWAKFTDTLVEAQSFAEFHVNGGSE